MNIKEAIKILKITEDDSKDPLKVKKAYRKLALKFHPDKKHFSLSSSLTDKEKNEKMSEINSAYQFLISLEIDKKFNSYDLEEKVEELNIEIANLNLKLSIIEVLIPSFIFFDLIFKLIVNFVIWMIFLNKYWKIIGKWTIIRFTLYSIISLIWNLSGLTLSIFIELFITKFRNKKEKFS